MITLDWWFGGLSKETGWDAGSAPVKNTLATASTGSKPGWRRQEGRHGRIGHTTSPSPSSPRASAEVLIVVSR
jgi:hypothetical protein